MSTNQNIIDRALRKGGVIESGESASAADSADALTILNSMMAEWRESGRDLNWFPQDDLAATCPIPDWSEKGIVANLTISCATDFRFPVTPDVGGEAVSGRTMITRTLFNLNLEQADMSHLPQGRDSGRNILTDS